MAYDRLTATDASFLHLETPHEPQHVGSLSYVEAGPLRDEQGRVRLDEVRRSIEARLHKVPRLRQKVMFVPYRQGRPIWVDDERFDIDYHVRLTALPRPGDDRQLHELFSRLQSLPLDRSRPLWELWLVDGVEHDHLGLVIKSHHALGDGIANVDLVLTLVDLEREAPPDPPAPDYVPRPAPSPNRLLVDSVVEELSRPVGIARAAARAARTPRELARTVGNAATALRQLGGMPPPAPWNVPVTKHRRWVSADVAFDDVRAIRRRTGVTVNDVVLELCTAALRTYLEQQGQEVTGRTLKAMVPVSRRLDDEHGATLGNRVSLIVADLPIGDDDRHTRLQAIHEQTSELKGAGIAEGVETVVGAAGELTWLAAPMARLLSRTIPMNLVITNIPGPPVPLYVRGAEVKRAYPYVEVIDNEGLTIAVVSYQDHLFFGLTADRDVMPDLHLLAEGIEKEVRLLAEAVPASSDEPGDD